MAIDVNLGDVAGRWPQSGERRPLVIGIAGGSGSGKTTIAEAVVAAVGDSQVSLVQHDSYYRDLSALEVEDRDAVNFDHPDSLETELLVRHLERLRSGLSIERPTYDFEQHVRLAETVTVAPEHVLIVEGILVLSDAALRDLMDLRIYVDTAADLRLLRRLQRDLVERARSVESVLAQYMATVRPMHLQFVEPSKRYADMIVPEGFNVGVVETITSLIRDYLTSR